MTEEEREAIKILRQEPDYSLDYYRRENAIDIILKLIDKQDTEINKLNNVIDKIKNKLEEHIKHCEQEANGSLNNEICNISLKFDKGLLEIINMEDK